jgi:hypothetical protein
VSLFLLLCAAAANAQTTTNLSAAEIQGRQLARQLCDQRPIQNSKNNGILKLRDESGKTSDISIGFRTVITETNWKSYYNIRKIADPKENNPGVTSLVVTHNDNASNKYQFYEFFSDIKINPVEKELVGNETMVSFAGSDFWICDLGLEFFHWPEQKILPKTTNLKRGRSYTLLESTNPNPSTNGYSRVLSWIDKETGGILEAEAYDAQGKKLKVFEPKSYGKDAKGQWQLEEIQIRNVQTGSRTRLEFDLKK